MAGIVYIEAGVLAVSHQSGVGLSLLRTVQAIAGLETAKQFRLLVPFDQKTKIEALQTGMQVETYPIPSVVVRFLRKFDALPPLDFFVQPGIFVFPNYSNTRLRKSRSCTFVYDLSFLLFPDFAQKKNREFLSRYIRTWVKRTQKVATISNQVAQELQTQLNVSPEKIIVNYLGVDGDVYQRRTKKEMDEILNKRSIGKTGFYLIVGNIEPRKNIGSVVKAYAELPERIRQRRPLVIVGRGGWNNGDILGVIDYAKAQGNKVLLIQDNLSDYELSVLYSAAGATIQASFYEGFGLVPLEALACGSPVLLSNIAVAKETVGEYAIYFDPEDISEIRLAMENIDHKDQTSDRHLEERRLYVQDHFNWEQTAKNLSATLDSLKESL